MMRNSIVLLIVFWVTPLFAQDISCLRDEILEAKIGNFDEKYFYEPKLDETLLKNYRNLSCLLISSLKIVTLDTQNPTFWNTIAALSVLERLTCMTMRGKTAEKFLGPKGEERSNFLSRDGHEVVFFGYHMANSELFLAPADAQQAIIKKWKAWYSLKSKGYNYNKCK